MRKQHDLPFFLKIIVEPYRGYHETPQENIYSTEKLLKFLMKLKLIEKNLNLSRKYLTYRENIETYRENSNLLKNVNKPRKDPQ